MTDTERLDFVIERQITVHHYPIGGGPHKYYTLQWRTFGGRAGPYAATPRAAIDAAIHQELAARHAMDDKYADLREALKWTAGALQAACRMPEPIREAGDITIAGETRTIGVILDAADAALAQEQS